jgi:nitroimidazol reductase NimA-like FMN-containing flavoprotein (pyridoxamine 5'-phosphate oxidase superfamily)
VLRVSNTLDRQNRTVNRALAFGSCLAAPRILLPVRRSEREITNAAEIRAILRREHVVRLAFAADSESYIVPVSYGYDPAKNALFLHTAPAGRKIDFIRRNPHVCFEVEGPSRTCPAGTACTWSLEYESLIGYGTLSEVLATEEKRQALACLMRQHSEGASAWEFGAEEMTRLRVWRLAIESVTGKRSP